MAMSNERSLVVVMNGLHGILSELQAIESRLTAAVDQLHGSRPRAMAEGEAKDAEAGAGLVYHMQKLDERINSVLNSLRSEVTALESTVGVEPKGGSISQRVA